MSFRNHASQPFALARFLGTLGLLALVVAGVAGVMMLPQTLQAKNDDQDAFTPRDSEMLAPGSHAGRFTTYEGSKTCNQCHPNQAREVHGSLHYQWQGDTPAVPNLDRAGKLGSINDFCTYPDINWIGQLTNLDGKIVDGGCSTCHVSMGAKPSVDPTQAQLDNIDCLICHSDTYKRKVVNENGTFKFAPAPEKMTVPLIDAITNIHKPTKATCLACHANAGGGNNNKRGDLEQVHANPPSASFDVHMASKAVGGAGLVCTDCHVTKNHRIAGRGSDMRATDLAVAVRCTNCHAPTPHHNATVDRHTARVDCATCHIPAFARITSTDMFRDFRSVEVDAVKRLYEPKITRQQNVIPQYQFFNGTSYFAKFGEPITKNSAGRTVLSSPLGSINDAGAKIFPFKQHQALQAMDTSTKNLIPLKMGVLFTSGNVDQAIRQGAAGVGWTLPQGYEFTLTERAMGIFHEVAPAANALTCNDCHNGGTRLNFAALGYTPKTQRNGKPLCASCHSDESGEWTRAELFTQVHKEHVTEKRIACNECHNFVEANPNPGNNTSQVKLHGVIVSLPASGLTGDWVVMGQVNSGAPTNVTVHVSALTKIKQDKAAAAVGASVKVDGLKQADGTITAREIEITASKPGAGAKVEIYGKVESLPASGLIGDWKINGRVVHVAAQTRIDQKQGQVKLGAFVQVAGIGQADGSVTANEIQVRGGGTVATPTPSASYIKISGVVTSAPASGMIGDWKINGRIVHVTNATQIENKAGATRVGARAEVKAVLLPDGTANAIKLELKTPSTSLNVFGRAAAFSQSTR